MITKPLTLQTQLPEMDETWEGVLQLIIEGHDDDVLNIVAHHLKIDYLGNSQDYFHLLKAVRHVCRAWSYIHAEAQGIVSASGGANRREFEVKQRLCALLCHLLGNTKLFPEIQAISLGELDLCVPPPGEAASTSTMLASIEDLLRGLNEKLETTCSGTSALVSSNNTIPESREFSASSALSTYCFGSFQAYYNNRIISPWNSHKSLSIFKYFIMHSHSSVPKEVLMETFWADATVEAARRNLHQAIYSLRLTLKRESGGVHPIQFENDCYFLSPNLNLWIDFMEFDRHFQSGRRLEKNGHVEQAMSEFSAAEKLYRGDFLQDDLYEGWTLSTREKYSADYCYLADRLSEYLYQHGKHDEAIDISRKLLERDNCNEVAHRRLMQCYQRRGERQRAARQYQSCVEALKRELGITPSHETNSLFENIIRGKIV